LSYLKKTLLCLKNPWSQTETPKLDGFPEVSEENFDSAYSLDDGGMIEAIA
jgi:hypothetical protein